MRIDEALDIRYVQRRKYLEDPNYERLSDILEDDSSYRGRRDNYLFVNLLNGSKDDRNGASYNTMENIFLEKHNRKRINWYGIYQYYQARLESLHNGEWDEPEEPDIENVVDILENYKDKYWAIYDAF